ncbi:MAG: class I SAM-dependent methyltransferase [Thermoleophilaceae bacterium]
MSEWHDAEKVADYRSRADAIPHRPEGERVLVEVLPASVRRVLDLGCGDGRLMAIVREARPGAGGLALDFSRPMLEAARKRFGQDSGVEVVEHDLGERLPGRLGSFDLIVSSFAIHHLEDERKRDLYREVLALLEPGGAFCNLEHVASATDALHEEFLEALAIPEDPSNKLVDVETQLRWLRELGFDDADCLWKWRELALLFGRRGRG